MLTTAILLILTLTASIVGIYWDSTKKGRLFLVAIATLSCGGALYQASEDDKEAQFNKKMMEHLVRAAELPNVFEIPLRTGVREFAKRNGLWMHTQEATTDPDLAIFFLAEEDKNPGDDDQVLLLREGLLESVFLSYIEGKPLADAIESELLRQWGNDDLESNWNEFAGTIRALVLMTATYHPQWSNREFKPIAEFVQQTKQARITVYDEVSDVYSVVEFEKDDILNILKQALISRDQAVFDYTTERLASLKSGFSQSGIPK